MNKIDDFIKIYDGIRYLVLRDYERYNAIYDRIKYFVSEKSGIINSINHNFERIRIDSSVVTKNKNYYYYNTFFKKGLYRESNTRYFLKNVCIL